MSASTLSSLLSQAAGWLDRLPAAEAWAVLLLAEDGSFTVRSARTLEAIQPLLEHCLPEVIQRSRVWVVPDLARDSRLASGSGSLLAVPISSGERLVAVLVAWSSQVNALKDADGERLALLSRGFGDLISYALQAPLSSEPAPPPAVRPAVIAAGLLTVCLALLPAWVGAPPAPRAEPKPAAPRPGGAMTARQAPPEVIAAAFLREASQGQSDPAYQLLSTNLQKRLPPARFRDVWQQWLEVPGQRWELSHRQVALLSQSQLRARLSINPGPVLGDKARPWTWSLLFEEGRGWRIDQQDGGPLTGL